MTEATGSGPCCGVPHPLPVLAGDDDRGRATRQSLSLEGLAGDQENLSRFNMTQKPAQATILHKCFHGPLIQQRDPDSRPQQRPAPQARCRYNWVTPLPPPNQLLGPSRRPAVSPARQPQGSRGTRTAHMLSVHLHASLNGSQTPCCGRSVIQLCPTFCDPMACTTPGFPVLHHLPVCSNI